MEILYILWVIGGLLIRKTHFVRNDVFSYVDFLKKRILCNPLIKDEGDIS